MTAAEESKMNPDLASELAYVRSLAEEGRDAPLVSGVYYLLWGGLMTVAALIVFRVLYLLIPFAIALVIVLVFERSEFRRKVRARSDLPEPGGVHGHEYPHPASPGLSSASPSFAALPTRGRESCGG